uniref:Nudix hydrolase domain-containing protein n=1 Tax=Pinguiococcus pyrenoidosus TaxID=172671 RepID=A0A7R9UAX6_9STRA|mmetsp:Transcript_2790/g.11433  ORF Transcript_2790/g.11433 Transcript_2790/m.11433 type:complete len:118 (+) Transcript_2790:508-861(+)
MLNASDGLLLFIAVGGFVEIGESVEDACRREAMEEARVHLEGDLIFLGIYSDPARDQRRHTVSVAYAARIADTPIAGDDASDVVSLTTRQLAEMPDEEFAFDHELIIRDYLSYADMQ